MDVCKDSIRTLDITESHLCGKLLIQPHAKVLTMTSNAIQLLYTEFPEMN
jgi:hypothetical protein